MKTGVFLSSAAHVAVLGFAMVSLGAPKPLPTPEVEALPIELVSISEFTRNVQGDRKAEPDAPPAPKKTQRQVSVPAARTVGDAAKDTEIQTPKVSKAAPAEKTEAPAAKPAPRPPEPKPAPKPEPVAQPKPPEPAPPPVKPAEAKPDPAPETDIAMLLKREAAQPTEASEPAEPEFKVPERVVAPKPRPARPKPAAKAADKKPTDAPKKATVNKAETAGGGAKASKAPKAGLGTKKGATSGKLAQSEIDALRGRLEGCWSVSDLTGHPDAATMRAKVEFKLTRAGTIDGRVKVRVSGTDRPTKATLAVRVRAAVSECAPYNLPAEKYDTWSEVVVNFSLADML